MAYVARPVPGVTSDDRYANFVRTKRDYARKQRTADYERFKRYYQLWRGVLKQQDFSSRHNVMIPLLFSYLSQDVSKKLQTIFGVYPYVNFVGGGQNDQAIAKRNEALVSLQMDDANTFIKAFDLILSADLYGTAYGRIGWKHEERVFQWYDKVMDMEVPMKDTVVDFDGPNWENVDPVDIWYDPNVRDLNESPFVGHSWYEDYDILAEMARDPNSRFDASAIRELGKTDGAPPQDEYEMFKARLEMSRNLVDYRTRAHEAFEKPVKIDEFWGLVPDELSIGGVRQVVITLANDKFILRARPNPFWFRKPPFFELTFMRDPSSSRGIGKIEVVAPLAAAVNRLVSQRMDVNDLFVYPMFAASTTAELDVKDNLYARPGRVFRVNGNVNESFVPIIPNMTGVANNLQEVEMLSKYIQQGTGMIEDVSMGISGNRTTAREFMGRAELAATRSGLETVICEQSFLVPLANRFRELNRQFLSVPKAIQMIGVAAVVDPITGLPMPQEEAVINTQDINADYKARARGSMLTLNKSMKQQNMLAALQAIQANPLGIQMVNWANFFREFFQIFDLDPDKLLNVGVVPMLNQMAQAQQDMTPEQKYGGQMQQGGTELEDMSPNQMPEVDQPEGPMPEMS